MRPQVNGELSWLNLGFSTFALKNVPPLQRKAYNQIINCVLLVLIVLAVHLFAVVVLRCLLK